MDVTGPKILTDDRGVTLTKSLAWTILTALVVSIFWFGATIESLKNTSTLLAAGIDERRMELNEAKSERFQIERRVSLLEVEFGKQTVRFDNLRKALEELKETQSEMNLLLRNLLQRLQQ